VKCETNEVIMLRSITRYQPHYWKDFFKRILAPFQWNNSQLGCVNDNLLDLLEQARREWAHAKIYFNNVTDPDLIDHAIFYMGATEKKYVYLLKRAREMGLSTERFIYSE